MSKDFSLNYLFQNGFTKEQFIGKYSELKNNDESDFSSIFGTNMDVSIGNIFDAVNTNGDDNIDEAEITALMKLSDDGDNNATVTENDLKSLYNKIAQNIKSSYTSTSPEEMYRQAMQGVDPTSSTYVQDLDIQIETLNELITSREINSSNIISEYQAKITQLIKENNPSNSTYSDAASEVESLQKEYNKQAKMIQEKSDEIRYNSNYEEILKQEIESLDPEKDKDKIASRQSELDEITNSQKDLKSEYSNLVQSHTESSKKLSSARLNLNNLTEIEKMQNSSIKEKISTYQKKIELERTSAARDIESYQTQLTLLENARTYAVTQLISNATKTAQEQAENANDTNNSTNNTSNETISFDELSKEGLKYSSEKGKRLANDVMANKVGFTGYCARYVANGLRRTGLGSERGNATDMDDKLRNNKNFREVKITSKEQLKSLPPGCIVVYERGTAGYHAKYGHIEVTQGNGTAVSDGVTRNMRFSEHNMSVFIPVENA